MDESRKLNEEWHVERNFGIRQIITNKTIQLVAGNLSKDLAFHLVGLHNDYLKNKGGLSGEGSN